MFTSKYEDAKIEEHNSGGLVLGHADPDFANKHSFCSIFKSLKVCVLPTLLEGAAGDPPPGGSHLAGLASFRNKRK